MAHRIPGDRVLETFTTTGTGPITFGGAVAGYVGFSSIPNIGTYDTVWYSAWGVDASGVPTGEWEVGVGTYNDLDSTLTRTEVTASSNSGAAVNFSAGTKYLTTGINAAAFEYSQAIGVGRNKLATDFNRVTTAADGCTGTAISSGTSGTTPGSAVAHHPGVVLLRSSSTTNSGYHWMWGYNDSAGVRTMTLHGGWVMDFVFKTPSSITNKVIRMGAVDTLTSSDANNGEYLEIPGSLNIVGKTANGGSRTTSPTIATLANDTWYHGRIKAAPLRNTVTFQIFDNFGTLLGSQTNSSNIANVSTQCTVGVVATHSSNSAVDLVFMDYMSVDIPNIQRGRQY